MRTIAAALLGAALAGCRAGSPADDPTPPPSADRKCPATHVRRHEIPIVYGPLKQDPETSRARWERKFVYGGPSEGRHAPRITELCDDCGYILDPRRDVWERESGNTDNFLRPLNPLIQSPPQWGAEYKTRPGLYRQAFKGETVVEECYSAATAMAVDVVWKGIMESLKGAQNVRVLQDEAKKKHLLARLNGFEVEAKIHTDPLTLSTEYQIRVRKD